LNRDKTVKTYSFILLCVVLSKAMGLIRDMCLAAFYGTGSYAAAFTTASRIPLLFFDITLGTAVASAFIPVFNQYLAKEDKKRAFAFANLFITTAGLIPF
jgi:putative peptidoglycan lipid II flippase